MLMKMQTQTTLYTCKQCFDRFQVNTEFILTGNCTQTCEENIENTEEVQETKDTMSVRNYGCITPNILKEIQTLIHLTLHHLATRFDSSVSF